MIFLQNSKTKQNKTKPNSKTPKKNSFKIFETIFLQNLWNYFPPKSLKLISSKIFETNFLQNLWNYFPPKSLKLFSSRIFEASFLQNLWNYFSPKYLYQISSKIFETIFVADQWEAGIWSCDLRANERPQKKLHGEFTMYTVQCTSHRHTEIAKESAKGWFFENGTKWLS